MLTSGQIPSNEPQIRVGIVLPEDQLTSITLKVTANDVFELKNDHKVQNISEMTAINFKCIGNNLILNDKQIAAQWTVSPRKHQTIGQGTGTLVKNVIAGRGFHWQKKIDVYLPGKIEIQNYKGCILLINELLLEHYLMCVATSEMGADCPDALIEAQTIVARSWMLANVEQKHRALGMDVCNDDCCQRYQGTANLSTHSISGAERTRGITLMYQEKICDARYSKSCGGMMERFPTVWGGYEVPYLQGIIDAPANFSHPALPLSSEHRVKIWIDDTPPCFCGATTVPEETLSKYLGSVDEQGTYFRWNVTYAQDEFTELLNTTLQLDASMISAVTAEDRGSSGRIITCRIDYRDHEGQKKSFRIERDVQIRAALHKKFLYSSCFYASTEGEIQRPSRFTLHGAGWGHGVGLCQIGALGMGLKGYSTNQITQHYYPGSRSVRIYE